MKRLYLLGFLSLFFISALFIKNGEADCGCAKKTKQTQEIRPVSHSLKIDLNNTNPDSVGCGGNCSK